MGGCRLLGRRLGKDERCVMRGRNVHVRGVRGKHVCLDGLRLLVCM